MDFAFAERRLAQDQKKMRGRRQPVTVSAKAKREADYRKKQQEKLRQQKLEQQRQLDYAQKYMTDCDRNLSVQPLGSCSLLLQPTSIHGDGDKIALPPSVLDFLTRRMDDAGTSGSPWTFRIGILNSEYKFPSSSGMKSLIPPSDEDDDDDDRMDEDDDGYDLSIYLEELSHKYISYTHGTVVEFTQEEDHVGLPSNIASALLDSKRRRDDATSIPVTRTVDPSKSTSDEAEDSTEQQNTDNQDDSPMDNDGTDATPGHVAYGAFDVPDTKVEISMIRLPKGKGCTLVPTEEAVRNGFYNLKDVKLVLEQSLIRTRATLSVGDLVHTWHRGKKFDLCVSKVLPATCNAVTCINTDIEVEIGEVASKEDDNDTQSTTMDTEQSSTGQVLGGGRILSAPKEPQQTDTPSNPADSSEEYGLPPPEPPQSQTEGVCTVQIRSGSVVARRRFDVQLHTLQDLFAFVASEVKATPASFQLVTRFPRNVYKVSTTTMAEAGITSKQELFMVETL